MPRKKNIDNDLLIQEIKSGKPSTEIMRKFGIKTSAQLKSYYMDALMEKGEIPGISRKRGGGDGDGVDKEIQVNKRGSLVVPKDLVEHFDFEEGDEFSVRKTKSGISLRKR
jgi:hypothetical protein